MERKQPQLTEEERRAYRVLDLAMRVFDITDQVLADRVGMTRQSIQQRRKGITRMRLGDVDRFAVALDVNPLVFSLDPEEALRFFADNYADMLIRTMRCFAA